MVVAPTKVMSILIISLQPEDIFCKYLKKFSFIRILTQFTMLLQIVCEFKLKSKVFSNNIEGADDSCQGGVLA